MCAPLAALPLITMIGAGVSAAAGGVATYAKIQQDNAQAAVADANANAEKQAAAQDQTSMNQSALQRYQQISQVEGQQRASQAANGVVVDYGSAGAQVQSTATMGDLDVTKIYQQGFQAQHGHDVNIANDYASASAARSNAVMSGIGGALSFGGSIASGVASAGKVAYDISGGSAGSVLGDATQSPGFIARISGFSPGQASSTSSLYNPSTQFDSSHSAIWLP